MRAIVTYQDNVILEVTRMDLGEAAARLQTVYYEHSDAVLDVKLPSDGEPLPREYGRAYYE